MLAVRSKCSEVSAQCSVLSPQLPEIPKSVPFDGGYVKSRSFVIAKPSQMSFA